MTINTFVQGYPQDGSSLGASKVQIRNNLDGTFQTLGIDHINNNGQPGSKPAGYHNVIHIVTQGSDPSTISGIDQVYSKAVNFGNAGSFTQLFHKNSGGGVSQLTGTFGNTTGYQFIGGVILMWGIINSTAANGTVSFPIIYNFPTAGFSNACFNVQLTPIVSGTTNHVSTFYASSVSPTGFMWFQADRSASQTGFYWLAIGN